MKFSVIQILIKPDVCTTNICFKELNIIQKRMDRNKNPCEDFYGFVCGDRESIYNPTVLLQQKIERQIMDIYKPPYKFYEHPMLTIQRKLYDLCNAEVKPYLDRDIFIKNYDMIKHIMKMLGEWPILQENNWDEKKFNWIQATYALKEMGLNYEMFFNISVVPNPKNTNKHILKISTKTSLPFPTMIAMKKFKSLLGVNMKITSVAIEDIFKHMALLLFEIDKSYTSPNNHDELFKISTIQQQQISDFNWLEFINKIIYPVDKLSESDFVLISNRKKVVTLIDSLSKIPKRTLANFIIWNTLEEIISSLQATSCYERIEKIFWDFPQPFDLLYLKKHFTFEIYKNVKKMIKHIEHVTLEMIKRSTKLNNNDKIIIIKLIKEATANTIIGAPEEYFDFDILNEWILDLEENHNTTFFSIVFTNRYLEMYSFVQKLKQYYTHKKIYKTVNETKHLHWNLRKATDNILEYYSSDGIVLPATILQDYLYNDQRPNYLNYGALGTFVAVDLINKFTDPLLYDDGWSNKTIKAVLKFRNCLLQQMKDYLNVIGLEQGWDYKLLIQALSTNISYAAYKEWEKENGKEQKLWTGKYTNEQLFWIAAGSSYCHLAISNKVHKTSIFYSKEMRSFYVSAIGINNYNFAKDFKCSPKSMMNPIKKCPIF